MVMVPEDAAPFRVIVQLIWPGPDESLAVPDHEPATLALEEGAVDVAALLPPEHAADASARPSISPARGSENRVTLMEPAPTPV